MSLTIVTVTSLVALVIGLVVGYTIFRYVMKSKYNSILKEAQTEAEVIKKNKLLEVKEKFLNKKADLEKEVAQRNQRIQQVENKLKQRELMLNQRQEEVQRKRNEADAIKANLENQLVIIDKKKEELDNLQAQEREKLETISGLSADEAKERLIESLKEEAKTQAQSYINDIMDDAKMTANKEAKRIVIQTIQRVATETAIENSVTVFHIDSDEKDASSDVKEETFEPWRQQPAWKSLSTTRLKPSCSQPSTPSGAKSPAWPCTSWSLTDVSIRPVSRKSWPKCASKSRMKSSKPANARPSTSASMASTPNSSAS